MRSSAYIFLSLACSASSSFRRLIKACVHSTDLVMPLIDGRRADVVLARKIGDGNADMVLLQERHNLAVGES